MSAPATCPDSAPLVLDGERATACCAVAGWTDRHHVLFEFRSSPQLHVLAWDTATGKVTLISTIEPVVSNEWYLVTSYREFQR